MFRFCILVIYICTAAHFADDFKSSEVGTLNLKTGSLQRSSVQPTIAFSESISNVNVSFFHLRIIFDHDRLLERVGRSLA